MKSIMISIKPEWIEKIIKGEKTIEIRKKMPKCELPCKVYIYCTKSQKKLITVFRKGDLVWSDDKEEQRFDETIFVKDDYFGIADERHRWLGKVVAEFTLNAVDEFKVFGNGTVQYWNYHDLEKSCLTYDEMSNYVGRNKIGYAWHIDDLKIYDKPKELSDFYKQGTYSYEDWLYGYYNGHRGARNNYNSYLNVCRIKRPFQSWGYVEELK